jgi:hypothetical protein
MLGLPDPNAGLDDPNPIIVDHVSCHCESCKPSIVNHVNLTLWIM